MNRLRRWWESLKRYMRDYRFHSLFVRYLAASILVVTLPVYAINRAYSARMLASAAQQMQRMNDLELSRSQNAVESMLALLKNMAYVTCPDCGKKIYPYGPSRLEETARAFGLVELGQLGIDPVLAEACDRGDFEEKLPAGTLPQMTETVVQVAEFTEFLANEGL